MIKTLIVDDNPMEVLAIQEYCKNNEHLVLSEPLSDGLSALHYLKDNKVDLLFLDVEMPEMSGLELIQQLSYLPQIIITTSNREYAFEAFEYDAADFLTKPVTLSRFNKAISKVVSNYSKLNDVALSSSATELYVKSDGKYVRLPYSEVLYFENVGDYIKVISERECILFMGH